MPMSNGGLTKLIEECGELIQDAAKKIAYPTGDHPDGKGDLNDRLENELADVIAAVNFVIERHKLDKDFVQERAQEKLARFRKWEQE